MMTMVIKVVINFICLLYVSNETKKIDDLLSTRVEYWAKSISKELEANWQNLCTSNECKCSYHQCTDFPNLYCDKRYMRSECKSCGSLLNLEMSTVRPANRFYKLDLEKEEFKEIICLGSQVEYTLKKILMEESMIIKNYFGSYNGIFRVLPSQQFCGSFDNRYRPWYVAATTGIKNILLVIDVSKNMSEEKFSTVKKASLFILSTLTFNDYAAIVLIGQEQKLFSPYYLRADSVGVKYMTNFINALKIGGESNYETAIETAFDIIDRSIDSERTSGCQHYLLFFSGGPTTKGKTNRDLLNLIDMQQENLFYFLYSVGNNTDPFLKNFACYKNGLYEYMNTTDFYPSTLSFFKVLEYSMNSSKITYSEPYMDAGGLGFMTTASIPVLDYSSEPPFVIGVVGFDILIADLLKIARIDEIYIAFQEIGSASCSKMQLTQCQLEQLRPINNKCGETKGTCSGIKYNVRKCPNKSLIEKPLCSYQFKVSISNCCLSDICDQTYIIVLISIGSIFLFSAILFLILFVHFRRIYDFICCKKTRVVSIKSKIKNYNDLR